MINRLGVWLCLVWGLNVCTTNAADRRLAFDRNDAVHIANLDASLIRNLAPGIFPAISPDAKSVAYTVVEQKADTYIRRLAIIDIVTGRSQLLTKIPSDNSYYGAWSPDGKWIAFTFRAEGLWNLGLIKIDGSEFKFIKKGEPDKVTLYSPCWAGDGQSIFCHDMTNIYRLRLDGSELAQWRIRNIVPNAGMSGDSRIDVSPDGTHLLLSVEMDEVYNRKDWDGPVPALWSFDLSKQTAVRLTPKNLFAWDGCWLDNANVMYVSQTAGEKQPALYRTNGKNMKRLIENARHPTVSR